MDRSGVSIYKGIIKKVFKNSYIVSFMMGNSFYKGALARPWLGSICLTKTLTWLDQAINSTWSVMGQGQPRLEILVVSTRVLVQVVLFDSMLKFNEPDWSVLRVMLVRVSLLKPINNSILNSSHEQRSSDHLICPDGIYQWTSSLYLIEKCIT